MIHFLQLLKHPIRSVVLVLLGFELLLCLGVQLAFKSTDPVVLLLKIGLHLTEPLPLVLAIAQLVDETRLHLVEQLLQFVEILDLTT